MRFVTKWSVMMGFHHGGCESAFLCSAMRARFGNALVMAEINGTIGNDVLPGTPDADIFNSIYPLPIDGGGEDKMTGGNGDDVYYVNSLKDKVVEAKAPSTGPAIVGIDTVYASISYKLAVNVEN